MIQYHQKHLLQEQRPFQAYSLWFVLFVSGVFQRTSSLNHHFCLEDSLQYNPCIGISTLGA